MKNAINVVIGGATDRGYMVYPRKYSKYLKDDLDGRGESEDAYADVLLKVVKGHHLYAYRLHNVKTSPKGRTGSSFSLVLIVRENIISEIETFVRISDEIINEVFVEKTGLLVKLQEHYYSFQDNIDFGRPDLQLVKSIEAAEVSYQGAVHQLNLSPVKGVADNRRIIKSFKLPKVSKRTKEKQKEPSKIVATSSLSNTQYNIKEYESEILNLKNLLKSKSKEVKELKLYFLAMSSLLVVSFLLSGFLLYSRNSISETRIAETPAQVTREAAPVNSTSKQVDVNVFNFKNGGLYLTDKGVDYLMGVLEEKQFDKTSNSARDANKNFVEFLQGFVSKSNDEKISRTKLEEDYVWKNNRNDVRKILNALFIEQSSANDLENNIVFTKLLNDGGSEILLHK